MGKIVLKGEIVCYAISLALMAWLAFNTAAVYDEFLFSIVAKGVANGGGWRLFYPEVFVNQIDGYDGLFNPEAAAGPLYILILALGVWLFGNQYWVTGFVNLCLVTFSVGAVFYLSRRSWGFVNRIAFVVLLILASTDVALINMPIFAKFIHKSYGDIFSGLLMLLAVLVIFSNRHRWRYVHAGVLASFSVLVKFLPFLSWCFFVGVLFIRGEFKKIYKVLALIILPIFFLTCWSLVKRYYYQSDYGLFSEIERSFFLYQGSGVGQFLDADEKIGYLVGQFSRNFSIITTYYGGVVAFSVLMAWSGFVFFMCNQTEKYLLLNYRGVLLMFYTQIVWGLFFMAAPWERHLIYGAIFLSYPLALSLSAQGKILKFISISVFIVYVLSKTIAVSDGLFLRIANFRELLESQISMKDYLAERSFNNVMGCDWAANRDIEYLLPGNRNFVNCRYLIRSDNLDSKQIYFLSEGVPGYCCDKRFEMIKEICERNTVFATGHHVLSRCGTAKEVVEELKSNGFAPF